MSSPDNDREPTGLDDFEALLTCSSLGAEAAVHIAARTPDHVVAHLADHVTRPGACEACADWRGPAEPENQEQGEEDALFLAAVLMTATPAPAPEGRAETPAATAASQVTMQVHLRLIVSSESSMPVPTELRYYRNDPFAVHVDFHTRQDTASWVFSRSLLTEGLNKPVGGGDVRVWPSRSHGQGVVCIALSSPEGEALLEAPRRAIASFLRRTEQVVPLGDEATQIDFDLFTDYLRASPGEN